MFKGVILDLLLVWELGTSSTASLSYVSVWSADKFMRIFVLGSVKLMNGLIQIYKENYVSPIQCLVSAEQLKNNKKPTQEISTIFSTLHF